MSDTIIADECTTVFKGGASFLIEPTYRDDGKGGLVLGHDQYKYDRNGNLVGFEHFDLERVRWQ